MAKTLIWIGLIATLVYLRFYSTLDARMIYGLIAVIEIVVVIKVILVIRTGAKALHQGSKVAQQQDRIEAIMHDLYPRAIAPFMACEIAIVLAFFRQIRRKPLPHDASETAFSTMKTSHYFMMLMLVLVLSFIEIPIAHVLVRKFMDGTAETVTHSVIAFLHIYSLLWIFGEYRLLAETQHHIDAQGIQLHFGLRVRGTIPYDAIDEIVVMGPGQGRPEKDGILKVVTLDTPNVFVHLKRKVTFVRLFGFKKATDELHLYVDEPDAFVAAAKAHLPADDVAGETVEASHS